MLRDRSFQGLCKERSVTARGDDVTQTYHGGPITMDINMKSFGCTSENNIKAHVNDISI